MTMRISALFFSLVLLTVAVPARESSSIAQSLVDLDTHRWDPGSSNCDGEKGFNAFEVVAFDPLSYAIRQHKCVSYEAPFIYLLIGSEKSLLIDTGAVANEEAAPLYKLVNSLLQQVERTHSILPTVLVAHTHSHGDHTAGDAQFSGKPNTLLVAPEISAVRDSFGFKHWPDQAVEINLGERKVTVIPTPGHQREGLSFYDHQSRWLITGDSVYPGITKVVDWQAYKQSIQRLTDFVSRNRTRGLLGGHIEARKNGKGYYKIGSTYQPEEVTLPISVAELEQLNRALSAADNDKKLELTNLTVAPLTPRERAYLEKMLEKIRPNE